MHAITKMSLKELEYPLREGCLSGNFHCLFFSFVPRGEVEPVLRSQAPMMMVWLGRFASRALFSPSTHRPDR